MKIVQGEYENGVIRILEEVPEIRSKKILITFFEENDIEEEVLRTVSLQQPQQFLKTYLDDEREDLYQEYLIADK